MSMNSRHMRTLQRIFAQPTPSDLRWDEIEGLLASLNAEISEGAGSRVRVALKGVRAVFHRPHPSPYTKRAAVRAVRDFLIAADIKPGRD
jgi:hypothetical protein